MMKQYQQVYFTDCTNLMNQIKFGERLVGKPEIKVRTVFPPEWSPNSTSSFAEAAIAWRLQKSLVKWVHSSEVLTMRGGWKTKNSTGTILATMNTSNTPTSSSSDYSGLSERHVAQIIRRKMIQRNHGDGKKYSRKNKNWSDDQH